jgi:aspartate/tyrosine/aromatic aminotransferase
MLKNENLNANWKLNKQQMPERIQDLAKHALHKKLNEKSCFVLFK